MQVLETLPAQRRHRCTNSAAIIELDARNQRVENKDLGDASTRRVASAQLATERLHIFLRFPNKIPVSWGWLLRQAHPGCLRCPAEQESRLITSNKNNVTWYYWPASTQGSREIISRPETASPACTEILKLTNKQESGVMAFRRFPKRELWETA